MGVSGSGRSGEASLLLPLPAFHACFKFLPVNKKCSGEKGTNMGLFFPRMVSVLDLSAGG